MSATTKPRAILPLLYVTRYKGQAASFLTIYYKAVWRCEWVLLGWN